MQVIRIWLVVVGITFMVVGTLLLWASAGLGRSFALGVLSAGILVLTGAAVVRVTAGALDSLPSAFPGRKDALDGPASAGDGGQPGGR